MPGVCGLLNLSSTPRHGCNRHKAPESHERAGRRGGKRPFLAVAEKEGKELGSSLHLGHQQGVAGRNPCHRSATMRCTGVKGAKHP